MRQLAAARARLRIGGAPAVVRIEAVEAEKPQDVLANSTFGLADEPHFSGAQVGDSADRVENGATCVEEERIHREISAGGVLGPIRAELDARVPTEGLDVAAKGRHLEDALRHDRGHGAVLDAG